MIKETVTGFDELVLKVVRIQIKCSASVAHLDGCAKLASLRWVP